MRDPQHQSTAGRIIHPHPDQHAPDINAAILAGDLCDGAIPTHPGQVAQAMLSAIEDHLATGDLPGAIHHFAGLTFLAGSIHRLSYCDPGDLYQDTPNEDVVCQVQDFADQALILMQRVTVA